jgi:hypothetical protein
MYKPNNTYIYVKHNVYTRKTYFLLCIIIIMYYFVYLFRVKCMNSIHHHRTRAMNVKRETNKVDRAKRMHCVRSERAIAITLVVRRL